jgi:hypothetical protein
MNATPPRDFSMWRLQAARALAWSLLLGGWIGLGSFAQALSPGPVSASAMMAAWLLALGAMVQWLGRLGPTPRAMRVLMLTGSMLGGVLLLLLLLFPPTPTRFASPLLALFVAMLAWAAAVALASATVRACRQAARTRPKPPVGAAVVGAALAWACAGNITDLDRLALHLTIGALIACALLALLLPRRRQVSAASSSSRESRGCGAGLFDCSLPNWSMEGWRDPQRRPVLIASLVMLPMMCSLPLMLGLCRSDGISPRIALALHLAAMFVPAASIGHRRISPETSSRACFVLLIAGGAALLLAPAPFAWWSVVMAHGAAWSVAWRVHLNERGNRGSACASPMSGAGMNACFAMAIGISISAFGLPALAGWHLAIAILVAVAAVIRRSRRSIPIGVG